MASFDSSQVSDEAKATLTKFQDPNLLLDHTRIDDIRGQLPEQMLPLFNELMLHLQVALTHALSNVFLLAAIVMAIAAVLTFAIKEVPLRSQKRNTRSRRIGHISR